MGHLINPIAYRLGHSRSWEDSWFTKSIYYPEFLHSILRIRQYIYYFWTTRFMEKKGILLSHLNIYKFTKELLIKIFLYNTDYEKYVYSFFARGVGIFSDSFYYRLKKKKKRKEPFSYQRYKPDLFFLLFLYHSYFSKMKVKRRKRYQNAFIYLLNSKNKKIRMKLLPTKQKEDVDFVSYKTQERVFLNNSYLDKVRNNKLNSFIALQEDDNILQKNSSLKIPAYENKIRLLSSKRLNLGFLDFLIYIFLKINMINKKKEDQIRNKKNRKKVEMIMNYQTKIQQWIVFLKKYIEINIKLSRKEDRGRSLRNFYFFLVFIVKVIEKVKSNSSRVKFRLRELNLRLIRLFIFNRVFTQFAFFYGKFLSYILNLLSNWKNFKFKFCFISNNSVNARFLTRYMGLKLKKKFPLFVVINPLKKEFRKLSNKKKDRKSGLLFNYFSSKIIKDKAKIDYKVCYTNVLKYLYNKYFVFYYSYYKENKLLITFDIFVFIFFLKKNYKYNFFLILLKKKFYNNNVWLKYKKKRVLSKKWIQFLNVLLKNRICKLLLIENLNVISRLYFYIKNKLLINLFFSKGRQNVDNLVNVYFALRGDNETFFFYNSNYIYLTIDFFFRNYNLLNNDTLLSINTNILLMSTYLFNSFMFYKFVQYSFNELVSYLNINKKKYYLKMKELFSTSSYILGYKMSLKGRFTRKQRASSVWFHQGFVPLNTIKGCVDYSFFTIPLKNSAVSIKLWLYKNTNGIIWDNKFLSKR